MTTMIIISLVISFVFVALYVLQIVGLIDRVMAVDYEISNYLLNLREERKVKIMKNLESKIQNVVSKKLETRVNSLVSNAVENAVKTALNGLDLESLIDRAIDQVLETTTQTEEKKVQDQPLEDGDLDFAMLNPSTIKPTKQEQKQTVARINSSNKVVNVPVKTTKTETKSNVSVDKKFKIGIMKGPDNSDRRVAVTSFPSDLQVFHWRPLRNGNPVGKIFKSNKSKFVRFVGEETPKVEQKQTPKPKGVVTYGFLPDQTRVAIVSLGSDRVVYRNLDHTGPIGPNKMISRSQVTV